MKYKFIILILLTYNIKSIAQVINQPANWPNSNWTLTGNSYAGVGLVNDPTISTNFSFDDDLAGSSSLFDNVAAESPTINLTQALNANPQENKLIVSFDYVFNQVGDLLKLEWWDPTFATWVTWDTVEGNSFGTQNYDYKNCIGKQAFTSIPLPISNFSTLQLTYFKYRFSYLDNGYSFGMCIGTPTLKSVEDSFCVSPMHLNVLRANVTSLQLTWAQNSTQQQTWNIEYVPHSTPNATRTVISDITAIDTYTINNINTEVDYDFYVYAKCNGQVNSIPAVKTYWASKDCSEASPEFTDITHNEVTNEVTIILTNPNITNLPDLWQLEYGAFNYEPGTNETITSYDYTPTSTTLTVTIQLGAQEIFENLDFYVRAKCGNIYGDWNSGYKFKQKIRFLLNCYTPNSVRLQYVSHTQPIDSYRIVYAPTTSLGLQINSNGEPINSNGDPVAGATVLGIQGGMTGETIVNNLDSESYDFYLLRYEQGNFSGSSEKKTIDLKLCLINCQSPTNIQATTITSSEIYLNWSDSNNAGTTAWNIEYGLQGFTQGTGYVINNITATNYTLTDLLELAAYDIYITADCNDSGLSEPTPANFTTIMLQCTEPADVQAESTDTTVYLSWLNGNMPPEPIGGWEIEYNFSAYTQGTTGGLKATTETNEILIENLVPSNTYDFYIRAKCGSNNSDWIGPITITTKCANCTSFKPEKNKEYILSAWVKEEHSKITEVALANTNNETNIKNLLNDLITRYTDGIGVPNGYYNTHIDSLLSSFQTQLITQANVLNTNTPVLYQNGEQKPGIYNFVYNDEEEEFQFQFVKGEFVWTENLLKNSDARANPGTDEWTVIAHTDSQSGTVTYGAFEAIVDTGGDCGLQLVVPHSGRQYFCVGGVCQKSSIESEYNIARVIQEIAIESYRDRIDNGDCKAKFGGFISRMYGDEQEMWLQFFDGNNNLIGTRYDLGNYHLNPNITPSSPDEFGWEEYNSNEILIPKKTRKIRMTLSGVRWNTIDFNGKGPNYSFFDDLYVQVGSYKNNENVDLQTIRVNCAPDVYGTITNAIDPASHYPVKNNHYNLVYDCSGTQQNGAYSYGENTYTTTTTVTPLPIAAQVATYNNVYVQLTYFDNQNNIVPDFTGQLNRKIKTNASENIIDGWQRIYGKFKVPQETVKIKIDLVNDHDNDAFFDDVRIFPSEGNMKSFVYDQITQKLMAELDENNYATYYEYDKEGGLIRVKKETEKGIFTIQETRSGNVKK